MARQRDEPVVGDRVDRNGPRAERGDEAVHEPVAIRLGCRERRQEPGRAVEEIGARMLGSARLGAADGMAADEPAGTEGRRADSNLRRAYVGNRAALGTRGQDGPHLIGKLGHRSGDDRDLSSSDRCVERMGLLVDRASLCRRGESLRLGVVADDLCAAGPLGGKRHRRADQARADHCKPPHLHFGSGYPGRTMADMPRYLIVRTFEVDAEAMPDVGRRSKEVAEEEFPEITWEHSHVIVDDTGTVRTYCVYEGPDEETIRAHGKRLGKHEIGDVLLIAGDVTPADFPAAPS